MCQVGCLKQAKESGIGRDSRWREQQVKSPEAAQHLAHLQNREDLQVWSTEREAEEGPLVGEWGQDT